MGVGAHQPDDGQRDQVTGVDNTADRERQDGIGHLDRAGRKRRLPEDEQDGDAGAHHPDVARPDRAPEDREGGQPGNVRQLAGQPVVKRRLQDEVVQQQQADRQQEQRRTQQVEALHRFTPRPPLETPFSLNVS
jgi:hypothetical protein